MNRVMRLACGAVLLFAAVAPAQAQKSDSPWRANYFPYPAAPPNDFPGLGVWYSYRQQADYYTSTYAAGEITADAAVGVHGSWHAAAQFRAPQLWPKWRVMALAGISRDARFGYFGLGNDAPFDKAVQNDSSLFYRLRRTRYGGMVEATRELVPHLRLALAGSGEYARFQSLSGASLFRQDFGGAEISSSEAAARITLMYDTRDREYGPTRGLFIEASALGAAGLSNNTKGYGRYTLMARGYLSVRDGTVLSARLGASGTSGSPSLEARYEIPEWESVPLSSLGGARTQRALVEGRYAGTDVLLASAEVRHNLIDLNDLGAITLIAFVDAGRVFEGEKFKITTDGMKVGGGGGVALRVLRLPAFTFNFAGGPDGFRFTAGSGWRF